MIANKGLISLRAFVLRIIPIAIGNGKIRYLRVAANPYLQTIKTSLTLNRQVLKVTNIFKNK